MWILFGHASSPFLFLLSPRLLLFPVTSSASFCENFFCQHRTLSQEKKEEGEKERSLRLSLGGCQNKRGCGEIKHNRKELPNYLKLGRRERERISPHPSRNVSLCFKSFHPLSSARHPRAEWNLQFTFLTPGTERCQCVRVCEVVFAPVCPIPVVHWIRGREMRKHALLCKPPSSPSPHSKIHT